MVFVQAQRSLRLLALALTLVVGVSASAGELRLKLPKRTKPTPVQKLNQDGVRAVEKHDYERARKIFYKAYLLDPNDPFTLNNLGYIAELDGEIERAQRYYALAAEMPSDARIDRASSGDVKGKMVADVAGNAPDREMQVNRVNVYAMGLLLKDRAPEADVALQKALALDDRNPFTLNNLGWAKEKEGELEQALSFYSRAASTSSREPVVVTINTKWRGRPISDVAAENADKVRKSMHREEDTTTKVARLNLRGVSAVNRNDRRLARTYFDQAYKLDPANAFTLNNMGYLAELDGDRETADFFYSKAQAANRSDARVAMATRREMEGQRLGVVAGTNDQAVANAQQAALEVKRREGGPVILRRRDNSVIADPERRPEAPKPVATGPNSGGAGGAAGRANANEVILPPEEPQPNVSEQPSAPTDDFEFVPPPLPDSQQPKGGQRPQQQANPPGANSPTQDLVEPLPDNQQPAGTQPPQQSPPTTDPNAPR